VNDSCMVITWIFLEYDWCSRAEIVTQIANGLRPTA